MQSGNVAAAVAAIKAAGATDQKSASAYTKGMSYGDALDVLQEFGDSRAHAIQYMSLQQKLDTIHDAENYTRNDNFAPTFLQNYLTVTGVTDTPQSVDAKTLASLPGDQLYRTVNTSGGVTGEDIASEMLHGDECLVSGQGGSAYGRGYYFANDISESLAYGYSKDSVVMAAKFDPSAKGIDASLAARQLSGNSYSYAGRQIKGAINGARNSTTSADGVSVWALMNGYDYVKGYGFGSSYRNVVNRGALIMSDTYATKGTVSGRTSPTGYARAATNKIK